MPWWISTYGVVITTLSTASVFIMARNLRRMRMHVEATSVVAHHIGFAASDMWDKLTPEQIRQLHPNTVDVGNGLPPWDDISAAIHEEQQRESEHD